MLQDGYLRDDYTFLAIHKKESIIFIKQIGVLTG